MQKRNFHRASGESAPDKATAGGILKRISLFIRLGNNIEGILIKTEPCSEADELGMGLVG